MRRAHNAHSDAPTPSRVPAAAAMELDAFDGDDDSTPEDTLDAAPGYRIFRYKALVGARVGRRLHEVFGLCAELFNAAVEERESAWRRDRRQVLYGEQCLELTDIRAADPAYSTLSAAMLQDVLKRVAHASKTIIKQRAAGRRASDIRRRTADTYPSITLRFDAWSVSGRWVHLHGIGRIKAFWSRPLQGTPSGLTVKRDAAGAWWLSVICRDVPPTPLKPTGKRVGADMGLESFATLSTGEHIPNPRHLEGQLPRVRRAQRRVARRKKGSTRHAEAQRLLARRHIAIRQARRDGHFAVAGDLCRRFDRIAVEALSIDGMSRGWLARNIRDAAWGGFFRVLGQTARKTGRIIARVDPRGTSQRCARCAWAPESRERKTLATREHVCPACGYRCHRDVNAAQNILQRGESLWMRQDGEGRKTTGALPPSGSRRRREVAAGIRKSAQVAEATNGHDQTTNVSATASVMLPPLNPIQQTVIRAMYTVSPAREWLSTNDIIGAIQGPDADQARTTYDTEFKFLIPSVLKALVLKGVVLSEQPRARARHTYRLPPDVFVIGDQIARGVLWATAESNAKGRASRPRASAVRQVVLRAVHEAMQGGLDGVTVKEATVFCAKTPAYASLDHTHIRRSINGLLKTGDLTIVEKIRGKGQHGVNRVAPAAIDTPPSP